MTDHTTETRAPPTMLEPYPTTPPAAAGASDGDFMQPRRTVPNVRACARARAHTPQPPLQSSRHSRPPQLPQDARPTARKSAS
jgi:hypothetical protein